MNDALGGPVCSDCAMQKSYEQANTLLVGDPDGAPSFSIEFEVCCCRRRGSWEDLMRSWQLLPHGYIRTHDCSVADEYKSPRYQSWDAFESVLPVLDGLRNLVDECCGTHIHVACPRKDRLEWYHQQVFEQLTTHWTRYEDETLAFWGRMSGSGGNDVCLSWRYDTIEFRLPRFRTAAQYRAVVLFCRQAGWMIDGWLENASDPDVFGRCAPVISEALLDLYRQHAALALATPTRTFRRPKLFHSH